MPWGHRTRSTPTDTAQSVGAHAPLRPWTYTFCDAPRDYALKWNTQPSMYAGIYLAVAIIVPGKGDGKKDLRTGCALTIMWCTKVTSGSLSFWTFCKFENGMKLTKSRHDWPPVAVFVSSGSGTANLLCGSDGSFALSGFGGWVGWRVAVDPRLRNCFPCSICDRLKAGFDLLCRDDFTQTNPPYTTFWFCGPLRNLLRCRRKRLGIILVVLGLLRRVIPKSPHVIIWDPKC